ncbi:Ankyrin repeat domain containing protein [Pandoravirus neocaledonia]|uniref:Ankyrin repeat domain containing protein n=1 Tax=Pandoravirus neocaledonia TaxID=2107708 RepID=A0A2U7UE15_9VIRU|nr:Ankyrin repeat domain containing protein [Pandoravirus neocaledonia]AVK76677.1 Ankyrin repeat domain containing protein [Pandoravirus neocaledonia]
MLPVEVIHHVMSALDDVSFCAARLAHRSFCVHSRAEIVKARKLLRWLAANQRALCAQGKTEAVDALCDAGVTFTFADLIEAAAGGHLGVVRRLHPIVSPYTLTYIKSNAAAHRMYNSLSPRPTDALNRAAAGGHIDVVRFLHENRTEGCTTYAMDVAAAEGHLDIVRFLHENRAEGCTTYAMDDAAVRGHLDVVRFLHENRTEGCTTYAMDAAADDGYIDIVRFLHENRAEGCTSSAMDDAAASGHLNVVRFLHEHRSEGCSTNAMDWAAQYERCAERPNVVVFLYRHRTEGCTPDAILHADSDEIKTFLRRRYAIRGNRAVRRPVAQKRRRHKRRNKRAKRLLGFDLLGLL